MPQTALEAAGIIANKNGIPNDPRPPKVTSGIRLGTPALTTRGLKEKDIDSGGRLHRPGAACARTTRRRWRRSRREVAEFCKRFPMPH